MFFFLSGLFVWPGIARKAPQVFLRDRLLRLGLPFVIAALTIIPIAYYALKLSMREETFSAFWWKTVTVGPWPSGPIWFIWVLLAFDLTASLLYRCSPTLLDPINRISLKGFERPAPVLAGSRCRQPGRLHPAARLLRHQPLVRASDRSRCRQAACCFTHRYFFIGAGVGVANFDGGVLSANGTLPTMRWHVADRDGDPLLPDVVHDLHQAGILGNPPVLPGNWYHLFYGSFFVLFSASILLTILAFFLHSKAEGPTLLDRPADAYGMFLVHYPIVLWLQYWMFDFDLPAIVKAAVAFVLTVILSWAATAALREQIPGANHVL